MITLNWEEIAYSETNSPIGDPAIDISQGHYLVFQIDLTDPANTGSITLYAYLSIDGVNFDTVAYTLGSAADTEIHTARKAFSAHSLKFKAEGTESGKVAKPIVRCYVNDFDESEAPGVKLIQYTGNDAVSQSIKGADFAPRHVSIYFGAGPLLFKSDDPYPSVIWDPIIPGWRSTIPGEHLTLDADGFTVQKDGANSAPFIYMAICFK